MARPLPIVVPKGEVLRVGQVIIKAVKDDGYSATYLVYWKPEDKVEGLTVDIVKKLVCSNVIPEFEFQLRILQLRLHCQITINHEEILHGIVSLEQDDYPSDFSLDVRTFRLDILHD